MLGYSCEWCKREKMAGERWILALAVERTSTSERLRQIQVLRHWSQRWARHPFAVHFCCEEHLEGYVQLLFSVTPSSERKRGRGSPVVSLETRLSAGPAKHYEAVLDAGDGKRETKRTGRRKSRATTIRFNAMDRIRAHGLGVKVGVITQ
jgi:hypothetical protein